MTFAHQTANEVLENGYTHRFDIYHEDLTQATAATAQSFVIFTPLRANDRIESVAVVLAEPLQNTADAAFNSNTVSVGDSGDLDNFIVAIETNKNGTLGAFPAKNTGDALPYAVPATPLAIELTVNSMTGKSLVNLNKGHIIVYFTLFFEDSAMLFRPTGGELVGG